MKNFEELKKKGKVTIEVISKNELRLLKKRFDPDTGEEIDPLIDIYLRSVLEINKKELQKQLADIEALLKEFPKDE